MSREMLYIAEETMHMRVEEEHRRADERRLLRLIRKAERKAETWRVDRWLCRLGHTLTALGRRLEQHGISPAQRTPNTRGRERRPPSGAEGAHTRGATPWVAPLLLVQIMA